MEQPGLAGRHRNKDGEISHKHGNTRVRTLRTIYGHHFAEGASDDAELRDILETLDEPSLTALVHDHEHGQLHEKIRDAV